MFFATSCCCSCCCCIVCNPLWKLLKCCLRDLARPGPASASASAFAFACSSSAAWSVIINFWRLGTQQGNHTELRVCVCVAHTQMHKQKHWWFNMRDRRREGVGRGACLNMLWDTCIAQEQSKEEGGRGGRERGVPTADELDCSLYWFQLSSLCLSALFCPALGHVTYTPRCASIGCQLAQPLIDCLIVCLACMHMPGHAPSCTPRPFPALCYWISYFDLQKVII